MATDKKKADKQKHIIDLICQKVDLVDKSKEASTRYRKYLSAMSTEEFHAFMLMLKNGEDVLYVNIPNLKDHGVSLDNNLKVAEKLGVQFYQRLKIIDPTTGKRFLTPRKYAVIHLPVRRQIQTIKSGISVPVDDKHIDTMTGQVTGVSRSAKLTLPENYVLYSIGLEKSIAELVKVRGGDTDAQLVAYDRIHKTGSFTLTEMLQLPSRAVSSVTFNNFLKTMHIDNNI